MDASSLLGPLENEVMEEMWRMETATVRQIVDLLLERRTIAYTTVMTIMNNLVTKGLLERTPQGKAYVYTAALSRKQFWEKASRDAVGDVLARFGGLAVARFLEAVNSLEPEDLERLKRAAGLEEEGSTPEGSQQ